MRAISTGWRLAKDSWRILAADQSLLLFPVLSFLASAASMALFLVPGLLVGARSDAEWPVVFYGVLGLYAATFCSVYFNVALAGAARQSMDGRDTSVRDGLDVARERVGAIACWAAVQCTVGLVINVIDSEADTVLGRLAGRIVSGLLGAAWGIATFLVVPVLAFEGRGPADALKRSMSLIRERWGEGFVGNSGIGIAVFACGVLPVAALLGVGLVFFDTAPALAGPALVLAALGAVAVAVISSALNVVFRVALYRYASFGKTAGGFATDDLASAFRHRRR